MDTPETVLVTIVCVGDGVKVDMELPATLPVENLKGKVIEALRNVYAGKFLDWTGCRIMCGNRFLRDGETLAGAGVFDGQYVNIVR